MGGRGIGGARILEPDFCLLALAVSVVRTASKDNATRFQPTKGSLDNFTKPRSGILIGLGSCWLWQYLSFEQRARIMPQGFNQQREVWTTSLNPAVAF